MGSCLGKNGVKTTGLIVQEESVSQRRQGHPNEVKVLVKASPSFEERSSTNYDKDPQFIHLREEDALWVTNMGNFFDEPVWREVLAKLNKTAAIESCSNASPFFGDLLQKKRERKVVLPKVFGILGKRYCAKKNKDKSFVETKIGSIPWKLPANKKEPHQMTGFWKCRLVCKKWNKAIEDLHQNEDTGHYRTEYDYYAAENYDLRKWGTDVIRTESRVLEFLGHFKATHGDSWSQGQLSKKNPFLGREIELHVELKNVYGNISYFDKLKEMLHKFGGEVWYFNVFYWSLRSAENQVAVYQKTKEIVELMPNLKVFRIHYGFFPSPSIRELQALHIEIEGNPFPKMAKLEMISASEIPGTFFNPLANQNRQITKLQSQGIKFNGYCVFLRHNFPNLSQLVLVDNSLEVLEAFESHPFTLNLQKFHFHFKEEYRFVPWSRVLKAVGSKLNPVSCTDLQLAMPKPRTDAERKSVMEDSLTCRLGLVNIQQIQVDSVTARFSLDFLLPSKNTLRDVKLHCDLRTEDAELVKYRDRQVIKFLGYEDNMQLSNIGKEFSNLKKLEVRFLERKFRPLYVEPNRKVKVGEEEEEDELEDEEEVAVLECQLS